MSHLYEDQTSRMQKLRKHQLYKNMLDEQLQFQNQYRQSQSYTPTYLSPQSRTSQPYHNYNQSTSIHQPYKRIAYPRNTPSSPHPRFHTQPKEPEEKYLDSCQQIIKNLRQLTQKRKEKELELSRLQNNLKPAVQSKKQRLFLKPQKTIQPYPKSTAQEKGKSMRVASTNRKTKRRDLKERRQDLNNQRKQSYRKSITKSKSESYSGSKQRQTLQSTPGLTPQQKQLYECMRQLLKSLKEKNEKSEDENRKRELINEQVQVNTIQDEQLPNEKSKKQSNISQLKLKALIKLRQLNNKSRSFVAKLKEAKGDDQKSNQNASKQKRAKQPRLKSRLEEQIIKQKQEEQERLKKEKEDKQNQQLLKTLVYQVNKQQEHNQSLNNFLKELSKYLRDQNEEMEVLRSSRAQKAQIPNNFKSNSKTKVPQRSSSTKGGQSSPPKKYRIEEFPKVKKSLPVSSLQIKQEEKPKVQHTKEYQNVLKEAFLKKLKKLRLRGKQLNDKIETYKKQQHSQKQQNQKTQPQNPQLLPVQQPPKSQQTTQHVAHTP